MASIMICEAGNSAGGRLFCLFWFIVDYLKWGFMRTSYWMLRLFSTQKCLQWVLKWISKRKHLIIVKVKTDFYYTVTHLNNSRWI